MENKEFIKIAIDWLKRNADCYIWYDETEGEAGMTDDFYDVFAKGVNNRIILEEYCDKLNQYLPCKSQEDIDMINSLLTELFERVEGSVLYWSRKIYIDGGFDDEKCRYIATHSNCKFVVVDDIEEHLGVKIIYDYEQE